MWARMEENQGWMELLIERMYLTMQVNRQKTVRRMFDVHQGTSTSVMDVYSTIRRVPANSSTAAISVTVQSDFTRAKRAFVWSGVVLFPPRWVDSTRMVPKVRQD